MNDALNKADQAKGAYVFRLYLAGGAPNSVRAFANLYAICQKHFPESHRIEVIDVLKEPKRALADHKQVAAPNTVVVADTAGAADPKSCRWPGRGTPIGTRRVAPHAAAIHESAAAPVGWPCSE